MQRIVIAYSPKSSKHLLVEREVLTPARKLKGYMICKFEILQEPVEKNATRLAKILQNGDLVIAAGGDGTATAVLNGVMQAKAKDVTFSVMGYGNFNDMARMISGKRSGRREFLEIIANFEAGKRRKLYPLESYIDGKFFRYAACYFTVGMFAESTEIFDQPGTRGKLKKGNKGLVYSVMKLAGWYFKNRKKEFLPRPMGITDMMFVNGKTVAKVMKGGDYWQSPEGFLVSEGNFRGLFKLLFFMLRSMIFGLSGKVCHRESGLFFPEPFTVEIQAEGEYKRVKLLRFAVKKSSKSIDVV